MIKNPICYTDECRVLVEKFDSLEKSKKDHRYWNSEEIEIVRKQVKDHYKAEQKYFCSYCRQQIKVDHSMVWDVEHIVAKSTHPQFMFEPKNLCVACKDCNLTKGAQNVLKKVKIKKYPTSPKEFLIIHPHLDKYEDHIKKLGKNVFVPLTDKGIFTINCCKLFRFTLKNAGWDGKIAESPQLLRAADELLRLDPSKIKSIEIKVEEEEKTNNIVIHSDNLQS